MFALVLEKDHGICIIRIEFVTGDMKIEYKQSLFKNQGLLVKKVLPINQSYILVVAERDYQMPKSFKLQQKHAKTTEQAKFNFAKKNKFETVIIRHNIWLQSQDHSFNSISIPLRLHQVIKPPFFHELSKPFIIIQIYNQVLCLNIVTLQLSTMFKVPNPRTAFPRPDLQSLLIHDKFNLLYMVHDCQVMIYNFSI